MIVAVVISIHTSLRQDIGHHSISSACPATAWRPASISATRTRPRSHSEAHTARTHGMRISAGLSGCRPRLLASGQVVASSCTTASARSTVSSSSVKIIPAPAPRPASLRLPLPVPAPGRPRRLHRTTTTPAGSSSRSSMPILAVLPAAGRAGEGCPLQPSTARETYRLSGASVYNSLSKQLRTGVTQ
jgi:hypothetical protein